MRKLFIISAMFFALSGILFTFFFSGIFTYLLIVIAIVLSILSIRNSEIDKRKLPKLILFISVLSLLLIIGKFVLIKNTNVQNSQYEMKE